RGCVGVESPPADAQQRRELGMRNRRPGLCGETRSVEEGCLMAYAVNRPEVVRRQVAAYVDKLLKGARAAELPVEQASVFELSINLGTAEKLGLTLPPVLLGRADRKIR